MRICSPQLGISPYSVLGGEVFDREVLLGLAKEGVEIEIILPKSKPFDKSVKGWSLTFVFLTHFPALLYNLLIIPHLFRIYRRKPFSIIRIHSPRFIGFGCLLFKLFHPNVKLVATYHQFRESRFLFLTNFLNNFWDHIVCDSENVRNRLIKEYRVPKSKITVVHNGVPEFLRPGKKSKQLVERYRLKGKIVLLFMGLFIDRKNPLFLIEVLRKLDKRNIVLFFLGTGPLEKDIINASKKFGISDQIEVIAPIYDESKRDIHNLADIFVHPSKDEGFALAPLEAMACGKPVIMNKAHSAKEAIANGENGFLCMENSVDDWVKVIDLLIKSKKTREKIGKKALERVNKEFRWSIVSKKHLKIFEELILLK